MNIERRCRAVLDWLGPEGVVGLLAAVPAGVLVGIAMLLIAGAVVPSWGTLIGAGASAACLGALALLCAPR